MARARRRAPRRWRVAGQRPSPVRRAAAALLVCAAAPLAQTWLPASVDPSWGSVPATRSITITRDERSSDEDNGARLAVAVAMLQPGDELAVGPGVWSMRNRFEIFKQGTETEPIRIVGLDPLERPVLTRPDNLQNVVNVGRVEGPPTSYLVLRDLELTGGSDLLRIYDAHHVWIDGCYLHDGEGVGIAANSNDVSFLHVTRNEIARPDTKNPIFTGEGMYLGKNHGAVRVTDSIIAYNHVHDTQVTNPGPSYQGDGIELKQGSARNWIVGNTIHGTRYPCLLVDGTGDALAPEDENVIERNVLWDSQDNVLQVQGDAWVRNNVAIHTQGGGSAFQSFAHQGPVRRLYVVHNTFLNTGRAANLQGWTNGTDLTFGNNVCYSQSSLGMNFVGGSAGVAIDGNVVVGQVAGVAGGWVPGAGLSDFVDASWTGSARDVTPVVGRAIDNHGAWELFEPVDQAGRPRAWPADPGALESPMTASADTYAIAALTGGTQTLRFDAGPTHADQRFWLVGSLTDVVPALPVSGYDVPLVLDAWTLVTFSPNVGLLANTFSRLDGEGRASDVTITLPPLLGVSFLFWHTFTVWDDANDLVFASNAVPLFFF